VSGSGGTTTFTGAGTLPYANSPSNTSYEIRFGGISGGSYTGLYVDWKTETPSSFYEGSPSLYTSVVNPASSSPKTPLRLTSDGTSGTGSVPVISGLSSSETGNDATTLAPFANVTVTDADSTTTTSATIILSHNGVATDGDGVLSGPGLTHTGAGTYTVAFTSPANLTAELDALSFKPTSGQVTPGNTVATLFALSVNDSDGSTSASTTLTVTAACFLRGTMIANPAGEVPVESLGAGDLVTVVETGVHAVRAVAWVGAGAIDAADHDDTETAFPVRVRRHAFADNVPHRDLLVTPEHCILTEAGLTPVRMLVNGRSIVVDRAISSYGFFHVELERHGILLAEGLATESYLDTGNRDLFVDAGSGIRIRRDVTMAAPLAVARALVEPIWTCLADRALALGFDIDDRVGVLTDEPDLRLLLDDGRELLARWHNRQRHLFHIPRGATPVRLLSRAAMPADVVGPFVDDRRVLGVAVDRLVLWTGLDETVIAAADLALAGWHAVEGAARWTNGRAELDLPEAGPDTFVDVHIAATGLYRAALAVRHAGPSSREGTRTIGAGA